MNIYRFYDLILILIFSPVILTLILIISFILIIFQGSPIFYKSERIGKREKVFILYKFRSMKKNTVNISKESLLNPEEKITSIGKYLRLTSLDELPQFYNVLKNDMSIVGYRPGTPDQKELNQMRREAGLFNYKPGLTGNAQVLFRDNYPSLKFKVLKDKSYFDERSSLNYFKILFKTLIVILNFKNIKH